MRCRHKIDGQWVKFKDHLHSKDYQLYRAKLWRINPMCQICKKVIELYEDATLDHILPRALGGMSLVSNLQLAHTVCNGIKGDKYPFVWPF